METFFMTITGQGMFLDRCSLLATSNNFLQHICSKNVSVCKHVFHDHMTASLINKIEAPKF